MGLGRGSAAARRRESLLHAGLDLGLTLVDTAEMYADGGAEELLGETLDSRRDESFLVSKVLPANATRRGTVEACERSLRRLRTDRLDLYLLHWRGRTPLAETVAADDLVRAGKIRYWGVSNFAVADLVEDDRDPTAGTTAHVQENHAAFDLRLTGGDLAALDRDFPPPTGPKPLEML